MTKKSKLKEIIIPKWIAHIFSILMILIFIFILYINQFASQKEKLPTSALIFLFIIFLIIIAIFLLSAYKGLPIYYLRERATQN